MSVPAPHFLLYAEAALAADADDCEAQRWRFVLRTAAGETAAEATDDEPAASRERLELLAVIRGLEALDQPSRVTLMTLSRSLQCGLESGLSQWRENNWHWERYGRLTPIKNADLWQRLDRLSSIHAIQHPQARSRTSDDLAPPLTRTTKSGKKIRIDQGNPRREKHEIQCSKHETRNTKHETNSKFKARTKLSADRFRHLNVVISSLFRISCFVLRISRFVLRILSCLRFSLPNRTDHHHANSRGVSRAHDRLPRRHERPARRPIGPTARRARAADDSA